VDTDGPSNMRKLTSFIGGLDLTGGRWDTPSHLLFSSLQNEHKGDFRNKSFTDGAEWGGPREPWHDWHCRIDGHAAYDVLTNFEQRWRKATHRHDDELLDINRIPRILSPSNQAPPDGDPTLNVTKENDPETWHVQVFRSIDSGSVKGFPKIAEEVQQQVRPCHVVQSQRGCHYMEKIGRFECISNSRGLGNQILLCCTDLILNIPV
jgi:phospholipase D1/2